MIVLVEVRTSRLDGDTETHRICVPAQVALLRCALAVQRRAPGIADKIGWCARSVQSYSLVSTFKLRFRTAPTLVCTLYRAGRRKGVGPISGKARPKNGTHTHSPPPTFALACPPPWVQLGPSARFQPIARVHTSLHGACPSAVLESSLLVFGGCHRGHARCRWSGELGSS